MSFSSLLSSGFTSKKAATCFAKKIVVQSIESGELCLELAANFINECFIVIGLNYTMTVDQLEKGGDYQWPQNMRLLYVFKYSPLFAPFDNFLQELCTAVVQEQQEHEAAIVENELEEVKSEAGECPVDWLMQLMAVWCSVYKHLLEPEAGIKEPLQFIEPVSRINYNLLVGMHKVRKLYRSERPVLDQICNRLYASAVQGIFCENTHTTIAKGLLNVFESDFDLFHQKSANTLNFYYRVFLTKGKKTTHLLVYKRLQKMLHLHSADGDRATSHLSPKLLLLTGILIRPNMQKVYFTTLKLEKNKLLLKAVLEFLGVLQSKIVSLDCFSRDFIDGILLHVFDKNKRIVNLAAKIAVVMMRRKLHDEVILKYLIDFYLKQKNTPRYLPKYVRTLLLHFPFMQSVDVYLKIISDENSGELVVCLTCQMLLAVYEQMVENFEKYRETIVHLLEILPFTLKKLTRIPAIGILMQIFAYTDLTKLQRITESFTEILIYFEKYIVDTFHKDTNLQYPLYFNLMAQLTRCLYYTNDWIRMEVISEDCVQLFQKHDKQLNQLEERGNAATPSLILNYCHTLTKLNVLLNNKYHRIDSVSDIFKTLRVRLIDTQQINEFARATNSFLDVYATEAMTACLVKLSNETPSYHRKLWLTEQTLDLEKFLVGALSEIDDLSKMSLLRIKAIFNCLIRLYCTFTDASPLCYLNLEMNTYHLLVQTLIYVNITSQKLNVQGIEETQLQPKRIHEYQQSMFHQFIELHKRVTLDSSANVVWKLCIYYGLSSHKFNDELAALLTTLARRHFKIYSHISPVMVFNLHKHQPALTDNKIHKAIKAHNNLIDNEMHVEHPGLLKAHIVLTVLGIIAKSLSVSEIDARFNRLKALKHLNVFVDNLILSAAIVADIRTEAKASQEYSLTCRENKYLEEFLSKFNKYLSDDTSSAVDTTMETPNS